jgi:hypothetical protein
MSSNIDYLFEDPPITGQKYALVSIVGPNMPQKCDVWGLKIRGVTNTLEQAKSQTQKLIRIDNNYDIYTVEVGKFFPLAVDPLELTDVEYQNEQLNNLIKGYLENREAANEQWHTRKNEMMQKAVQEGKDQNTSSEHPIAVLQAIQNLKDRKEELKTELFDIENKLISKIDNFNNYKLDERETALKELTKAFENLENKTENDNSLINDLNNSLDKEYKFHLSFDYLNLFLSEIKFLEHRLSTLSSNSEANKEEIEELKRRLEDKKKELNTKSSSTTINDYINVNYKDSPYNFM